VNDEPFAGFEDFVRETGEAFLRYARYKGSDLHSAQDAVQDVYLNMFRKWETISRKSGSLSAYGRAAVAHAVADQFRRKANSRTATVPDHEIPELASNIGIPEAAYEMAREGIDELISGLPDRQRQVIILCVIQDFSPAHAGTLLGLKEETVKRYIIAAVKRLQKAINEPSEEVTA
jgi:RNA polymerase sigma factor (sigma-70 family)